MKIKHVNIQGLFGREKSVDMEFHDDLNIVTGANGSGKTTIMKLIWYIVSGRTLKALVEVPFSKVFIETDCYKVTVIRTGGATCRVDWEVDGKITEYRDYDDEEGNRYNAEDEPDDLMTDMGSSLFFPTFRRIEGGFASPKPSRRSLLAPTDPANDLEKSLKSLSEQLSHHNHQFVSALSTSDIERLLLKQYTDASENASQIQKDTSAKIIAEIGEYKQERYQSGPQTPETVGQAEGVLDSIRSMIDDMERQRENALSQYNAIRNLVLRIFRHSGIKVGRLSMGDAAAAISSDALSAGEKQMLSFLCYNAFYGSSLVFIDEPELSLHVDWQRQLFPTLFSQKKNNQFIIATHSPFIYSRYPDKEIVLEATRGDTFEDGLDELL
tara:strand:+ start:482 stop:1630 length:1149 start_codon:yes stop_codon:yes gene_type:complete